MENKHKPHVVWQEILKYYKKSDIAKANATLAGTSLDIIRSDQFDTRTEFINKFQSLVNTYNDIASVPMTDPLLIDKLEIATSNDKEFWSHARLEKQMSIQSNTTPTFEDQFAIYSQVALDLDCTVLVNPKSSWKTCNVYGVNITPNPYIDWDINKVSIQDSHPNPYLDNILDSSIPEEIKHYGINRAS